MTKQLPQDAARLIDSYFEWMDDRLPDLLRAFYISGSISLDAYMPGRSDIDFVAVLQRKATERELEALRRIHREIAGAFPKIKLDGIYVRSEDLSAGGSGELCPRFNEGKLKGMSRFHCNSVDGFQLKKYGIAVRGPRTDELDYFVDWDLLLLGMRDNLNTYWQEWLNRCRTFPSALFLGMFLGGWAIEWGVLGITRLYYTFREKDIVSKTGAGEYALRSVPEQWHKIISEAMALRRKESSSHYRSVFARRNDAIRYMEYMMRLSNDLFDRAIN